MVHKQRQKLFVSLIISVIVSMLLFIVNCRPEIPRETWSKRWGPLVSHRTFPGDCSICHTTDKWNTLRRDFSFNHEKETGYALKGAHAEAACLRCHNDRGPVMAYVARGCGGCHPDPHASTLGLDCERCHGQMDWTPTGLIAEHARTRFHLVAAHAVAPCESCHLQAAVGQFKGAPVQCELCHQRDLSQANSPDHIANGWTTNCERCHTPTGWSGADFEHYFFPLTGGHAGLDCISCHTSGTFQSISSDCYSCHEAQYQSAPNHLAMSFPHDCESCHNTTAWSQITFVHPFPLTGGHAGLDCISCHTDGSIHSIPSDCYSCHEAQYQSAPDHLALSFPHDCESCHNTTAWSQVSFSHPFPLTGVHNVACDQCHTTGSVETFNCLDCHSQASTDSRHSGVSGYSYNSLACYQCHPDGRADD